MNLDMFKNMISDSSQFDKEKKYWLNKFAGEPKKSCFPYDSRGKDATGFDREAIHFQAGEDLCSKLDHLTNRSDNNLFAVLTTALALLLNRYTGNDDIVMGMPILKQDVEGDFLNVILALRNRLDPGMTVKEFLLRVKQTVNEANEHSNYPIERLEYYLGRENGGSGYSLFETVIAFRDIHESKYIERMNHNMVFIFRRCGGFIEGTLEYNRHLYRRETAEDLAAHFLNLLENMIGDLNRSTAGIDILLEKEREQLLAAFNDTRYVPGEGKLVHELFEDRVMKTPENRAAVSMDNSSGSEVSLTYSRLNETSNRLARFLRKKGLGIDTVVALILKPSLEMAIGIMAVLKAGGAYLPIDHESPGERMDFLLAESRCRLLLTQDNLAAGVNFKGEKINIEDDEQNTEDGSNPEKINRRSDLFYTIYTSGTTGRPKGGLLTHGNLLNYVTWFSRTARLSEEDNTILTSSYAFDLGYTVFLGSMAAGGELHLIPKEMYIDAEKLLAYIKSRRISYIKMTPSLFSVIVNTAGFSPATCSTLRLVVLGGEAINVREVEKARQICPHIRFMNHYGPTETTIGSVARFIDFDCFEAYKANPTIGKPIYNTRIYILDNYLGLLPIGIPGELAIGGEGTARGYLNHPELTAEKFVFSGPPGAKKMYKTGDLARWLPDGNIEFLGRKDNQVKIRGFRIEPGEIENQILKCDEVKDAVVIVKDDKGTGKYVCAYMVPVLPANLFDLQSVRDFLSGNLPDFMMPSYFGVLEEIPLTPNGKLDRNALPSLENQKTGSYTPPQNEIEKALADLWGKSLNIKEDQVSVDANFFQLGGHSLSAAILISKIHQTFDVQVPLVQIFEKPTVRDLAEYLKGARKELFVSIPAVEKKEYYPLSSAQSRLFIIQEMDLQSTVYNVFQTVPLEGEPDREKLTGTFKKLIDRHESLRISFDRVEENVVQIVHQDYDFEIENHEAGTGDKSVEKILQDFVRPFDLSRTPLLRAGLIKCREKQYILMVDMHHIISDGVSRRILIKDFVSLNQGIELPGLRLQYKDYSQWQQDQMEKGTYRQQEEYWLGEFQGEIPILNLPTDYSRPPIQSFEGSRIIFEIGKDDTEALKKIALEEGTTLFMVLVTLFNVLLSKISGQDDVIIGIDVAGRFHAHLQHIIGMFVNTLALRNYPAPAKPFKGFLQEVKERTLKAFDNQEYQFEDLVAALSLEKDVSRNPIFDVLFSFREMEDEEVDTTDQEPENDPNPLENATAKFDLTLSGLELANHLRFSFEYCTKLYQKQTIQRFINYFKEIISSIIKNPDTDILEIEMISEEEETRLLKTLKDNDSMGKGEKEQELPGPSEAEFEFL